MRDKFVDWCGLPKDISTAMDDWEFTGHYMDAKLVAVAAMKGTEIHFAIDPKMRLRTIYRDRAIEFLTPLFERKGFLTTRVMKGAHHANLFVRRLGFEKTNESDTFDCFMLSTVPFAKTYNRLLGHGKKSDVELRAYRERLAERNKLRETKEGRKQIRSTWPSLQRHKGE